MARREKKRPLFPPGPSLPRFPKIRTPCAHQEIEPLFFSVESQNGLFKPPIPVASAPTSPGAKPLEIQHFARFWAARTAQLGKLGFFFAKSRAYTCPCVNVTGFSRARMAWNFPKVIRGDASEATGTAADASPQTEKSRDAYPLAGNYGQ